ncbi:hydrogenase nickel incorporation protein HypB [Nocardioides bruguierae]|uniref:hydrogenase nickel incorporation protein HypB n=1 Tax=Nocardioides bruguierae TaxID=2945102 RepID=UPI00202110AA|nr:hydrogenase nickel incorporation protein HypB [Nocardioides bruguierae]MCL8025395.1 hydrogenase nickel incorporation protein HypB [Nocardioides bruguierae]
MGRFHRHDDGTVHDHEHSHDHDHPEDEHAPAHEPRDHGDHGDHSAYETGTERIEVLERIFGENDLAAASNREAFDAAGVTVVNLMSSPGAGKTSILERTLAHLQAAGVRAGVVEGDIETSIDADRLTGYGAQISLLNTGDGFGGECHLDAPMVRRALDRLDLDTLDLLMIENVGNLVCPAEFDVGAHRSVMVYSLTEGEEKPLKYPVMFRSCELVLLNKVDLVPHLDADPALFAENLRRVNPGARVIEVSARTGQGLESWYDWLATAAAPAGVPDQLGV